MNKAIGNRKMSTLTVGEETVLTQKVKPRNRGEIAALENMERDIFRKLRFPDRWAEEGIAPPNDAAKMKSFEVCKKLLAQDGLIPAAILPTKEEGVYISYNRIDAGINRTMIIEVYNTLETALIVCDNAIKETIYCEDVAGMDFKHAVSAFKS